MRNIMIFAAIMIGLGTFMAQMADRMSSASATSVPLTVAVASTAPAGGRSLSIPRDGRGQVILTTHSPQLLDYFPTESLRVVDIDKMETRIGPVAPEQMESLRERLLQPGELLTVDPARLSGQLDEVRE